MHKQSSSRPLRLPSPSNALPCDFNRVWLRMTARECLNVCSAYNLITSSPPIGHETDHLPSDLSAEGALAWMSRNQGNGNYYFGVLDPLAPKKITNVANMTLWLDGQDRATLLDGSGDPVGDGGKVATRFFKMPADKSGAGHHFTQGTSVDRPNWHGDGYVNFFGRLELYRTARCGNHLEPVPARKSRASPTLCVAGREKDRFVLSESLSDEHDIAQHVMPSVDDACEQEVVPQRVRTQTVHKSTVRARGAHYQESPLAIHHSRPLHPP